MAIGSRTLAIDRGRDLHHGIIGHVRDRAVVAQVHDLHVTRPGVQRCDQRGGGIAVERTSPLFEQRRLRVERRVAVELQQARLDLHDLLGPWGLPRLLRRKHAIDIVVVVEVVAGDRTERLHRVQMSLRSSSRR